MKYSEEIFFTDKNIFKKILNLNDNIELFYLNHSKISSHFIVWEKYFSLYDINSYISEDINHLSYTIENDIDNNKYLTIYKTNENNIVISTMDVTDSRELIWQKVSADEKVNVSTCVPSHIIFILPEKSVPVTYTV